MKSILAFTFFFILSIAAQSASVSSSDVEEKISKLLSKKNVRHLCAVVDKKSDEFKKVCAPLALLEVELKKVQNKEAQIQAALSDQRKKETREFKQAQPKILAALKNSPKVITLFKNAATPIENLKSNTLECTPPESSGTRACEIYASTRKDAKLDIEKFKSKRFPADEGGGGWCETIVLRFRISSDMKIDESSIDGGVYGTCSNQGAA